MSNGLPCVEKNLGAFLIQAKLKFNLDGLLAVHLF